MNITITTTQEELDSALTNAESIAKTVERILNSNLHHNFHANVTVQLDEPVNSVPVLEQDNSTLIADLVRRAELGLKKYNTFLLPNNGRCGLTDAYDEALDLIMYAAQADASSDNATPEYNAPCAAPPSQFPAQPVNTNYNSKEPILATVINHLNNNTMQEQLSPVFNNAVQSALILKQLIASKK